MTAPDLTLPTDDLPLELVDTFEEGVCRVCGCTDEHACPEGCWWADETLTICDRCVKPKEASS